jgi:hypothetical protein
MEVLRTAILDFCRRSKGRYFSPSEVIRQLFPEDWELFIPEIQEVMIQLYHEGLIEISQNGIPIDPKDLPGNDVRIKGSSKPK